MMPNILIFAVVPLRYDFISCYGYPRPTTPHIDSLAAAGVVFEKAYSTAVWTPPAHASLVTGLQVSNHQVTENSGALDSSIPTLPGLLSGKGYHSVGFITTPMMGSYKSLERGFQVFYWQRHDWRWLPASLRKRASYRLGGFQLGLFDKGASAIIKAALNWLSDKRRDPFFMLIGLDEPHSPYNPPWLLRKRYLQKLSYEFPKALDHTFLTQLNRNPYMVPARLVQPEEMYFEALRTLYAAEVAYTDALIGRVLDFLRNSKLLESTVVVFLGEHGESIGENGLMAHEGSLYETLVHIPLIIRFPGASPAGLRVPGLVQLIDVMPTLLEIAGVDTRNLALDGMSLLPVLSAASRRDCVVAEWEGFVPGGLQKLMARSPQPIPTQVYTRKLQMIRCRDHKFIQSSLGDDELFDLAVDPGEQKNLGQERPEIVAELRARLAKLLSQRVKEPVDKSEELKASVLRDLRDSGYKI